MPGGADLGYCRTLNGEGNRRISQYVKQGGSYLGLCAGGYYACARCEFEEGKKGMEVCGDRELAFFPGIGRGLAFPGFVYHSEAGTRAAELRVNKATLLTAGGAVPDLFRSYYNGGGAFVNASQYSSKGIEILASYTEKLSIDSGEDAAAIVYCKVGEGAAILTGPHPEFAAVNLNKADGNSDYPKTVDALAADDKQRVDFMKACLAKLGLQVSQEDQAVPSLSRLHLSSVVPSELSELVSSWAEIIVTENGEEMIKGENDTFHLEKPSAWSMANVAKAVSSMAQSILPDAAITSPTTSNENEKPTADKESSADRILDYDKVVKRLIAHETSMPDSKETPYFNHHAFFANLKHYNDKARDTEGVFGRYILYGEVVTSTNTMLEKNPTWLSHIPSGLTATATTQVAGRGRGSNVWVSPPGSLMFSTVMRHPLSLSSVAPVVFVQYLAALAIVAGIHSYDRGYATLPVKLKWPNDIYALDPSKDPKDKAYVKIGGILVNSSYSGGDYTLVAGVGLNVTNAAPTTSLNALATKAGLPPFTLEKLLASILVNFESLYKRFCRTGFGRDFEEQYYRSWLHSDQIVTLEAQGGVRARIKGITRDWGLLVAEELGWEDRRTGKVWELQSDSNSFDFFKGLVKRKI
ncbi:biotin holocarboxylase synthetase [Elasticomyces elasticus]|nr:biotin holocarboxylase synthetase [Elasticomyces elasticus]